MDTDQIKLENFSHMENQPLQTPFLSHREGRLPQQDSAQQDRTSELSLRQIHQQQLTDDTELSPLIGRRLIYDRSTLTSRLLIICQ